MGHRHQNWDHFDTIKEEGLTDFMAESIHRPRKSQDWQTPAEVFNNQYAQPDPPAI